MQRDPTMLRASYLTFEPIENSTPTLMTISFVVSPLWHSPPLAESCLPVMTITIVMSGIHSRVKGLGYCLGTITGLVVWESVVMVSPCALEVGTVYSRSVPSSKTCWTGTDDRSGHRRNDAHASSEPFSTSAYSAFLEFSETIIHGSHISSYIMSFILIY